MMAAIAVVGSSGVVLESFVSAGIMVLVPFLVLGLAGDLSCAFIAIWFAFLAITSVMKDLVRRGAGLKADWAEIRLAIKAREFMVAILAQD